jgi:fluoride exporter
LPPWRSIVLVGVGGAVGALVRTSLSAAFPPAGGGMPWSTLAENVSGAFLLAWLLSALVERLPGVTWARPLLGTGLLGAYTTFATVGLELHLLVNGGHVGVAAGYLAVTWVTGLGAAFLGVVAARGMQRRAS